MDMPVIIVLIILICGVLWFLLGNHPTIGYQPKPMTPEKRAEEKLRDKQNAQRKKVREFVELFGFDPSLLHEDRYTKELLLKLAFHAKELKNVGENAARFPHIYRDSYAEASKEYMETVALIGHFDPAFQKSIPHWTELHAFVNNWMHGEKLHRTKKQHCHTVVA